MRKLLLWLLMASVLVGCSGKKNPSELFEETASGVVVVLNAYYYEVSLPSGESLYFTGLDEDGDIEGLVTEEDEIMKNRNVLTGTAFFIDEDGTLMTNRHVAQPDVDAVTARRGMMNVLKALRFFVSQYLDELSNEYSNLEAQKADCYYADYYGDTYVNREKLNEIVSQQEALKEEYDKWSDTRDGLSSNMDIDGIKIRTVCELGVAYNDTYVTTSDDFVKRHPCVVKRVSDKDDVDLALIQLKDKKTPEDSYVFRMRGDESNQDSFLDKVIALFKSSDKDKKLEIDQQLYMIGYNAGLVLANTKQGIKAQMTSGKVTQQPDGQRLLYSIPTLQGSSGSPVIDEEGYLVAVNFAKLAGTDNFNFGIPLERIRDFMRR